MTVHAETFYDQLCQPSSSSQPTDIFPWNQLPKELQVKILRNLNRRDLSRCRSLSKEIFEIILNSESSMRRRHLDLVRIERIGQNRVQLVMRCDEEGKNRKWITCQKRKRQNPTDLTTDIKKALMDLFPAAPMDAIASLGERSAHDSKLISSSTGIPSILIERLADVTKGSEIDRLRINEMELSDGVLSALSSCLLKADCRVRLLSFELTSLAAVTPAALLRFVRDLAPADIVFRMVRGCSQEHFSAELCRFIASRRFFSVSELVDAQSNDVPLSIDDVILAELTATTFQIAAPNLITAEGLRSFIRGLTSGKRQVVAGRIQTNFPVDKLSSFLTATNAKMIVIDQKTIDISSGEPL
ncbi:F-box domain protein [Trichostrongylus colubriformis]|uniref:F-box domain protein n=1 Tax=Trichostrongylus colubriformis TaxID=6319 RepID=A0AAN8IC86_TRICO